MERAASDQGFSGTVHHYTTDQPSSEKRIDSILTRGPLSVKSADIHKYSEEGQYPSDHFPITTELHFT